MESVTCSACGWGNPPGLAACQRCGAQVGAAPPSPPPPPAAGSGTYGYGQQPYGQPQPAGNDRTQLWGILALVFTIIPCCLLVGIIFAILQIVEARKWGKSPTMGYAAIGIAAFWIIVNIILTVTGNAVWTFNSSTS